MKEVLNILLVLLLINFQNCSCHDDQIDEMLTSQMLVKTLYYQLSHMSTITTYYDEDIINTINNICTSDKFNTEISTIKTKYNKSLEALNKRNKEEIEKLEVSFILNEWAILSDKDQLTNKDRRLHIANLIADCYNLNQPQKDIFLSNINLVEQELDK